VRESIPNLRDHTGERLGGTYRLLRRLAIGGMAEIYLAGVSDGFEDRYVVIKLLRSNYAHDPEFVRMFLDEGSLAVQLEHPNIGQVYDTGEERGFYYIAMEYLHGHDARAFLDHAIAHEARIPLDHVLTIVTAVAAGLHHAHELHDDQGQPLQIVHRDVSPSNIFITYEGAVKLVDFGLAATQSSQARAGVVQGKTAYMSPEQCRSQPLDRRSDVFSLGTVLYELTTGQRLFRTAATDTNYEIMDRIVNGLVTPPSQVVPGYSAELQAIVMRALAVDPADRYATAQELRTDLEAVARTEHASLSAAMLARYVKETLGDKPEPWIGIEPIADDEGDEDDGDLGGSDEFDDEGATTLYSGSIDDLEEGWIPPRQATTAPPVSGPEPRPSLSRLALPLQAEDSDVFQSPLLAKLAQELPPGELAARVAVAARSHDEDREDHADDEDGVRVADRTPSQPSLAHSRVASAGPGRASTHPGARAPSELEPMLRAESPGLAGAGARTHPCVRAPSQLEVMLGDESTANLGETLSPPTRWWLVAVISVLIVAVLAGIAYVLGVYPFD
jgi:serine/threonine protein kinase